MPLDTFFRGPYYSRRRLPMSRLEKPVIRKLVGTPTWVCCLRDMRLPQVPGFGLSPADAYRQWKFRVLTQC